MASKKKVMLLSLVFLVGFITPGKGQDCETSAMPKKNYVDLSSLEDSYPDRKVVRLRCEVGYVGMIRATCKGGTWSLSAGQCQKKPCGHPGDTANGDFDLTEGEDFVFGAVVEYKCKAGYRMMSRNPTRNCMASGWDNDIPVCEVVQCPIIAVDAEVKATGNLEDGSYGNVISFDCYSQDKQLTDNDEIYCTKDGTWSGPVPKCKEIECARPNIPNGKITSTQSVFNNGDVLNYVCDPSYRIPTGLRPKCTKHGWSSAPGCEEIRCTLPVHSSAVTSSQPGKNIFKPQDTIEITCAEGFQTTTRKHHQSYACGDDGKWEPESKLPDCEGIYCSQYHFPARATIKDRDYQRAYGYNSTVDYDCSWGLKKTTPVATCKLEGWTPKTLCVRQGDCIPPTIDNGYLVTLNKNNVRFSCHAGYKLTTGGWWVDSRCSEGTWSQKPLCIEESKCAAKSTEDEQMIVYSDGESRTFECEPGYTSDIRQIQCTNGQWEIPDCKRDNSSCTHPPIIQNGIIDADYQSSYKDGSEVKYACQKYYKLDGEEFIKCNSGDWTDPPTCIPPCTDPSKLYNVSFTSEDKLFLHGTRLQFDCHAGFTSSFKQMECHNGTWQNPKCERDTNQCLSPPIINNGAIVHHSENRYLEGSEVKYTCDAFYQIDGSDTITCRSGDWTIPPTCKRMSFCERPKGDVEFSPDLQRYDTGSALQYTCKHPYSATHSELKCEQGEWDHEAECKSPEGFCIVPSEEGFAEVLRESRVLFRNGEYIDFQCPPYMKFNNGGRTRYSNLCWNGRWRDSIKCLRACTVTQQDMDSRNIKFKVPIKDLRYLQHNDHFTFVCTKGRPVGGQSMRYRCEDGHLHLPECQ